MYRFSAQTTDVLIVRKKWPTVYKCGGDNYVILLRTVIAAVLEAYCTLQCSVVNLRVYGNCCVWNYTPVEKHGMRITLA